MYYFESVDNFFVKNAETMDLKSVLKYSACPQILRLSSNTPLMGLNTPLWGLNTPHWGLNTPLWDLNTHFRVLLHTLWDFNTVFIFGCGFYGNYTII